MIVSICSSPTGTFIKWKKSEQQLPLRDSDHRGAQVSLLGASSVLDLVVVKHLHPYLKTYKLHTCDLYTGLHKSFFITRDKQKKKNKATFSVCSVTYFCPWKVSFFNQDFENLDFFVSLFCRPLRASPGKPFPSFDVTICWKQIPGSAQEAALPQELPVSLANTSWELSWPPFLPSLLWQVSTTSCPKALLTYPCALPIFLHKHCPSNKCLPQLLLSCLLLLREPELTYLLYEDNCYFECIFFFF